jgi:hypothetical protein
LYTFMARSHTSTTTTKMEARRLLCFSLYLTSAISRIG